MGHLLLSAGLIGSLSAAWSCFVETGGMLWGRGPKLKTSTGSFCCFKRDSEVFSCRFAMIAAADVYDV